MYTHKKAKAVEYMVVDALTEADVVWNNEISNSIWDVTEFIRLDDSILKRIEWSREPALKKGREIIRRIRNRELYCYGAPPLQVVSLVSLFLCYHLLQRLLLYLSSVVFILRDSVNEYSVPEEDIPAFKPVTELDITSCQGDNNVPGGLKPEDIIIHNLKIDYSMKNKNPVDSVNFFQEYHDTRSFHIDKNKVSVLLPSNFMERKVRVYSKSREAAYIEAVEQAFVKHQRQMYKTEQQLTPTKKLRHLSADELPSEGVRMSASGKRPRF